MRPLCAGKRKSGKNPPGNLRYVYWLCKKLYFKYFIFMFLYKDISWNFHGHYLVRPVIDMHQFTSMRGPNRYDVMGTLIFCTKVKSSAHERIIMSTFFPRGKFAIFAIRRSSFRSLFYLPRPSKPGKWALRIFNDGISTNGALIKTWMCFSKLCMLWSLYWISDELSYLACSTRFGLFFTQSCL